MVEILNATFSGDSKGYSPIVLSEYVAFEPNADGESTSVRFTLKEPVNFKNLVYFCGGYIDPLTRNYYASRYRIDAVFPLFTLDSVMPAGSPISAEKMVKTIVAFSPTDEDAFQEVWYDPVSVSFVAKPNRLDTVMATMDAIVDIRKLLNKFRKALTPFADMQPMPDTVSHNFSLFLEHLIEAEEGLMAFMLKWTVLDVLEIYPKPVNKKLVAIFNFPLFEMVHEKLNVEDHALLARLFEEQRDGSLEDNALLHTDEKKCGMSRQLLRLQGSLQSIYLSTYDVS